MPSVKTGITFAQAAAGHRPSRANDVDALDLSFLTRTAMTLNRRAVVCTLFMFAGAGRAEALVGGGRTWCQLSRTSCDLPRGERRKVYGENVEAGAWGSEIGALGKSRFTKAENRVAVGMFSFGK